MSDIFGDGHGSAHNWRNLGTSAFQVTRYRCESCGCTFRHAYEDTPDIFDAMRWDGVPVQCAVAAIERAAGGER